MKVKDLMTGQVIPIAPEESVAVAARTLTHYNIGALPVCNGSGSVCGVVTDRDLVTRCIAAGKDPCSVTVREVMTDQAICANPNMEISVAAHLMGRKQIRRLPVVEGGKLCGILSLGDLTKAEESTPDAADVLADLAGNISRPDSL